MVSELEKRAIVEVLRSRYRRARKAVKGKILSEVCKRLSIGRKHAIRLLSPRNVGRPKNSGKRGRPSRYQDFEFIQALRIVWKTTNYMCSRHLRAAIPHWLSAIEEERGTLFPPEIRERLLKVSAPTIDRCLRAHKGTKGKSFTRSSGFRDQIPIQENIWDIALPGYMEADTAAHCGGSMMGEFISSFVMVDIATIWTEARATWGRGARNAFQALIEIEKALPFSILGYDADNGGEVLNQQIYRYFHDERIANGEKPVLVTRSREYRKNDNAHVEQRNNSVPRRWLGYDRLGFEALVPLINHYYGAVVCPLMNHFYPSFKLHDKVRIQSRTRRVYRDPVTPFERVMQSPHISARQKARLRARHALLNPVALTREEARLRKRIDTALRCLKAGEDAQRLLMVSTTHQTSDEISEFSPTSIHTTTLPPHTLR